MARPTPKTVPLPTSTSGELRVVQAEFDALAAELDGLRDRRRRDFAQRLRDARDHGSSADNDDLAAVRDEVSLEKARIARLERLLRDARIVDAADDGIAGVGCTIDVADLDRRNTIEYRLVGHRGQDATQQHVTPGSPVGAALIGAAAGEIVRVELPNGRVRRLRVLAVAPSDGRCDVAT